ncbi:helix-turn-helix domain-containing protein [bacterium]|nr:helix-turn-helix domain-containing protein [bacterium]
MGKIEQTLRSEITRLARKEIRAAVDPLASDVRELKRTVRALTRTAAQLQKALDKVETAPEPQQAAPAVDADAAQAARLSPGLIKKLRKKLGVTQSQLAALLDSSPSTVAFWEQGRTRPKAATKARIVALRSLGRRDVEQMLAAKGDKAK